VEAGWHRITLISTREKPRFPSAQNNQPAFNRSKQQHFLHLARPGFPPNLPGSQDGTLHP
jgi:hypothetical protein